MLPRPSPNSLAFDNLALARWGSVIRTGDLDGSSIVTFFIKPEHEVVP